MSLQFVGPATDSSALADQDEQKENTRPSEAFVAPTLGRTTSVASHQAPPSSFPSQYRSSLHFQRNTPSVPPAPLQPYSFNIPAPPLSYSIPQQSIPQKSYSVPPQSYSVPPLSSSFQTRTYPTTQVPTGSQIATLPYPTFDDEPPQPNEPPQPYPSIVGRTATPYASAGLPQALHPQTQAPDLQTKSEPLRFQQPSSRATTLSPDARPLDTLATVSIQDGEDPQYFTSAAALASHLRKFSEADNDQGCRVLKYGPDCPTSLLMPLFEHFDFPRYSTFPYGLVSDFSVADQWGTGSCRCEKCLEGQLCGHYVLQKNFQFYALKDVANVVAISPKVTTSKNKTVIGAGDSQFSFVKADWNLQFFRFRSRRLQTTEFAFDALIYQNYEGEIRLKSSPLDYVLAQIDVVLTNWDSLLHASSQFLSSFRFEVLEERLETDRRIIRNLLIAAQHWEEFRRVLQAQLRRIEFLENIHEDTRWTEGRDNYYELMAIGSGYLQRFRAIDFRITSELMQETDNLLQRVTNLITIDEGYRSRDQNASIRRLTWITFIFLPMIFTAAIFSMQVDLFSQHLPWQFYIYTALVMMFIVLFSYYVLRSRRRILRLLGSSAVSLLSGLIRALQNSSKDSQGLETSTTDLEGQLQASSDSIPIILKWAASSGRTDIVRNILQAENHKKKVLPGMSGEALLLAIQNGHLEAANLLIDGGEGFLYTDKKKATVLHWAARMGQSTICRRLLDKNVPLHAKDVDDLTALDWAIEGDDELTINLLLKGGKNFTRQETADLQSLHFSARTGDLDMIKEFHEQGSSLEARDSKGQTVLFHAVKGKQHGIVSWLVQEGRANVQAIDKQGLTALHVAAQVCDLRSAEILLENKADVNARSSQKMTPLHCVPNSEGVRIMLLLHEKGADINAFDKDKNRIIHRAASKGDSASLLFKIAGDRGANLEAPGAEGNTPAHLAADSGSRIILGLLYQKDIRIDNVQNAAGYTPLMMAARAGKLDAMRYLLERGVSYNVTDSNGRSLIELSIDWGNPEVMSILQGHGANYQHVPTAGSEAHPVWRAVQEGQSASIAKILDGGVSIEYEHRGVRLLQLAIEVHNVEVVRLLIERGATVDAPDMRGWTALHSAAWSGNVEITLFVLQKIKDKTPKDQQGWTPLDIAAFYKHDGITKLFDPDSKVTQFAWTKRIDHFEIRKATSYYQPPVADSLIPGVAEVAGHGK